MIIIPAIDLMNGKCVRLVRGKKEEAIFYDKSPNSLANGYTKAGAKLLHVVDIDGAFTGEMENFAIIRKLAAVFPIQVGGGVRSEGTIAQLLEIGVRKVVVSSVLFGDPNYSSYLKDKFGGSLVGSLDFVEGKLSYGGWLKRSEMAFEEVSSGLDEIIVTCSDMDGTLAGPDFELFKRVRRSFEGKITAAGGVRDLEDLKELKKIGMDGAIAGRAFLENRIRFKEVSFEI